MCKFRFRQSLNSSNNFSNLLTVSELESLGTEGLDGYKYIFCKILQGNQLIDYDISVGELMKLVNLNEKIKFAGDTVNHIYHVLDIRRTENPAVYDFLFCPKRGENVQ